MPPPELVIFLDENHCNNRRVLDRLAQEGVRVERHSEHFAPGTADTDWLPVIGQEGWVVITSDKRIRRRALEKQAVSENRVRFFCFTSNDMSGQEMADALGRALPSIRRIAENNTPPYVATISKSGSVNLRDTFET